MRDTTAPLWEEWFHCHDLGTQLGPVIKRYFASEEYKTGTPPPGKCTALLALVHNMTLELT